ncbi:hypothetical protein DUNSADRAFT_14858 [Dunaliella salina]|uniref:Peptidase M14 domain-containing protein n=1 Tax=Dunaliella salina TaxID=3046 RepID=A0ABQ7H2C1_DUNSA|nr:hypothetical protein DUNSADRAFT_14858 [Dunaliella salina]|eukprot:KAF5841002.1 hypothetical protein DUNSADRAFT_14858 [Dunaliella salina]
MPPENLSYLKKVQEMYSMFQPHGHPLRAPSPELQPSLLPHITSAITPSTSSLPPLQPQQASNSFHDKPLKPRLSVSAPNRFLQRSKSKSASNLFDRNALEDDSFHAPQMGSPQHSPAQSTKLPPAIPHMAAATPAHPYSPSPPPLIPSSLQTSSAVSSQAIILAPQHAIQHPSTPNATPPLTSGSATTPASVPDDKPATDRGTRGGTKSRPESRKGSRRPSFEGNPSKPSQVQPDVTSRYRKRGCCDKEGMHYDFGKDYVPGKLPEIGRDQDIPNLPARSGTGTWLRPARVGSTSCVPPPDPEPLLAPPASLCDMMTMHDQMRELQPDAVMNRIIYDCVLPPVSIHAQGQAADANDKQGASVAGFPAVVAGDTFLDLGPSNLDHDGLNELSSASPPPAPPTLDSNCENGTPYAAQFNYFPDLPCWYSPSGPEDRTLVFESRFEGGNLRRAIQVYPNEYDLVLRPDVNTRRHTQWFYFAISNTRKGQRYKFNIINLMKEDSLYCVGMLPLIHSEVMASASKQQEAQQQGEEVQASSPHGTSTSSRVTSWPDMSSSSNKRPSSIGSQASTSSRVEDSDRPSRSSAQSKVGVSFEELQGQAGEEREQQATADGVWDRMDHQQQDGDRAEHREREHAAQDCQGGGYAGWHRGGEQVCYYRNTIKRNGRGGGRRYFTLSFTYTAQHDNDVVHFAHCFPFTYTDLQVYLKALENHPQRSPFVHRSLLTTTLAGNAVDCLTITAPPSASDPTKKKKGAVITARVHPGESNSSWMVRGLIEYLTGSSAEASMLRKHFVFKVVPMLNPDGA